MKFCCLSDTHGFLPLRGTFPQMQGCDAILMAGDICPLSKCKSQMNWLDKIFRQWLEDVKKPVFVVAGNHDWPMYNFPQEVQSLQLPWHYLQDSTEVFNGLNIYGTPHSLVFNDWAFNLMEHQLMGKWNLIPDNTDILLCHSPPKHYGDQVDGKSVGSESLLWRIQQLSQMQLKLCCFGHIHEGRGTWQLKNTTIANVTTMDARYEPVYPPMIFEI